MIKGFVDRRITQRFPFNAEVTLRLEHGNTAVTLGTVTDISSGGIQFTVAPGQPLITPGTILELIFSPPMTSQTPIKGEVCYQRQDQSPGRSNICYGLKFLDLSTATWNYIYDYCHAPAAATSEADSLNTTAQLGPFNLSWVTDPERQNYLYQTNLTVDLQFENGRHCDCTVKDISFAGLRLRLAEEIPVNQLAILHFNYEASPFQSYRKVRLVNSD